LCAAICLIALAAVALPPSAAASEAGRLIERCAHGQSLTGFKPQAYAKALSHLPTILLEYSNCEEQLRAAELQAATTGGGAPGSGPFPPSGGAGLTPPASGGGGGLLGNLVGGGLEPPLPATPAQEAALRSAAGHQPAAVVMAGSSLAATGSAPLAGSQVLSALPNALLAALAGLGAAIAALTAAVLWTRRKAQMR